MQVILVQNLKIIEQVESIDINRSISFNKNIRFRTIYNINFISFNATII